MTAQLPSTHCSSVQGFPSAQSWAHMHGLQPGAYFVAAVYERAKDGVLQMTPSELQLFIEGSEAVGRVELSPPLLTLSDLTPRWPGKKPAR